MSGSSRFTSYNFFLRIRVLTKLVTGKATLTREDPTVTFSSLKFIFALLVLLPAPKLGICQNDPVPKRLLLLGQKPDSHPAATHEYMAGVRLIARLMDRLPGCRTIVVQADSPWTDGPEILEGADGVVVFLTEGAKWISDDERRLGAFKRLASRGGGLTCLHWGMGTREAGSVEEFTALFGACHGGPDRKYNVLTEMARPTAAGHPVVTAINPFKVRDEFYYALKLPPSDRVVSHVSLLTVPIDGSNETVAWATERSDQGRSFGFSGLHYHENWKLPEYRRLVTQGIAWTVHAPIPAAGLAIDLPEDAFDLPDRAKEK